MRPKLLIVLFGAAAFFCALFGFASKAQAAQADEGASLTMVTITATASPAATHANVAHPGTYAAKFGAPLCDDRGASAYAAEPRPAPVDGGELASGDGTSDREG